MTAPSEARVQPGIEHAASSETWRGGVTEAAVERGEPILIRDVETWTGAGALRARLRSQLDPPAARTAWEWYRTSSFISCPVRTAGGRTLGVLALSASPPRPALSDEHLRVTEVFASLAALALERSELLEREACRARTEELLHGAAQQMTASLDLDTVYRSIAEQAALVADAPLAMLLRIDAVTGTLRPVAIVGGSESLGKRRLSIDEGMLGRVARTGEPYVSRAQDREHFLPWLADEDIGSFVHLPLGLGPRRFGVLSVGHPDAGALGERERLLLESLSRPAAGAIANALEFQHERRIAGALTRGFIPDAPPELEGFSLGLVYEPVGHEVSGGDIFGVWRLPGGQLAVLVGDVSGKGLEVAAVSAVVRFFIEARTWDSACPGTVLAQANAILRSRLPGRVALVTAFLAIIDGDRMVYANAGHVPQFGPQLIAEHAATSTAQGLVELAYAAAVDWTPQLEDDVAILALRPAAGAVVRDDAPDGPASRSLFAEYLGDLCLRLPEGFEPPEHIFATEQAFSGEGAAWLVVVDEDGEPLGCGGAAGARAGRRRDQAHVRIGARAWLRARTTAAARARAARGDGGHAARAAADDRSAVGGVRAVRGRGLPRDLAQRRAGRAGRDLAREAAFELS